MAGIDLKRTITTGGNGIIGSYIPFGTRLSHGDLDVVNRDAVTALFGTLKPSAVIHLAALTDMERCETDPTYAWRVNVGGTLNIAEACRVHGAKLVYVSTGIVFGQDAPRPRETDIPEPKNVYARTKYAGEFVAADLVPDHLILRTSWVFGGGPERDHKFVGTVMRRLLDRTPVRAIADQVGSTTFTKDFVGRLTELIAEGRRGVFHVVNDGAPSRFEIAQEISRILGVPDLVSPATSSEFKSIVQRPRSEILTTTLSPLRSWHKALREYLRDEWPLPSRTHDPTP